MYLAISYYPGALHDENSVTINVVAYRKVSTDARKLQRSNVKQQALNNPNNGC